MTEYSFSSIRWIDGKQKKVIVDMCGDIINRDPTKEDLKCIRPELSKSEIVNDKDLLLEFLRYFNKKEGRPPKRRDLDNNPKYPSDSTYLRRFGGLEKAKKLIGQDLDSIVMKGILENTNQKARLAEIFVLQHDESFIDLAGDNRTSSIDGICPKKQTYDVKSSKFHARGYWMYILNKIVDFYYLFAFNYNWTELLHTWRIPGIMDMDIRNTQNHLYIGYGKCHGHYKGYEYNIENMKEYEITEKFMVAFNNWIQKIKENK